MNHGNTEQPPPVYGYLRVFSDADHEAAPRLERDMERFARHQGLRLMRVQRELAYGRLDGFTALVDTLRRTGAQDVCVPSLGHLGQSDTLQRVLMDRLETSLGVTVHLLDELRRG
ncbi:hypothetical protein OG875_21370 [Streptomyces sp. NBC_01498]|uniref:recombinase family protein n=1 Tax=Streptomyces sp. NBC_01498 TaxID=2975870 RepID=UPI002E7B57FC|nr:recombinase family protein [Streptomyces sp. NBC_01498]WTL26890.1 hypothetical protein OG875_21370 [Streptomyces sp. NBC_01498]